MTINPVAFKSVYKVTLPNVKEAKNEQEKNAFTDTAINTIMMGANNSIAQPRMSADQKSVYFKLDNKNDSNFENGFSSILAECNKIYNVDMAQKAYIQKVDEQEFNNATLI